MGDPRPTDVEYETTWRPGQAENTVTFGSPQWESTIWMAGFLAARAGWPDAYESENAAAGGGTS